MGRNVSSTKARVLCAFGEDLKPYLCEDVIDYIEANKLYRVDGVKDCFRYLKPSRRNHSLRLALMAGDVAAKYRLEERKIILAAALHDVAKNMPPDAPELAGFSMEEEVPPPVLHQFTGAYVAEHVLGVTDADVLGAVRWHTSAKPNMTELEKAIYLADMLEPGRDFRGVESLRKLFYTDLDACLLESLRLQIKYLKRQKGEIYHLTLEAYQFLKERKKT
ncbi:MAG: bis(5'-nucleosyl)-tetraphosphatase (symmetrical) YqeK [Candidatus Borkfalkia sp.]